MKRYIKNNNNFSNISFVIGISNVNSNTAKVTYNHNKLRGRPRKMIIGENVEWHFHIYVIGNEFSSASYFSTLVKDILILKRKYRVSISTNDNIDNALNYVNKQCISYWKYGQYFNSKIVIEKAI